MSAVTKASTRAPTSSSQARRRRRSDALRSLAASLLLDAKPTTYRSLQGWVSCLPMGLDLVGMRRTFDTDALSAAFPFTSPDLPPPDPTRSLQTECRDSHCPKQR